MKIQKTFMTILKHLLEYLSEWKSKRTTSMIMIHLSDHLSFLQHLLCKRYSKFSKFFIYEKYWKRYLNIDSKTCLQDNCQISNCLLEYLSLWNTYLKDIILHHWIQNQRRSKKNLSSLQFSQIYSIIPLFFYL